MKRYRSLKVTRPGSDQTQTLSPRERQAEFKHTEFFRAQDDDVKLSILRRLSEAVLPFDVRFLIGHALCHSDRLKDAFPTLGTEQHAIQWLAYINISDYLAPYTGHGVVQTVVDLGLSEAFKPLYDMYVCQSRELLAAKQMGIDDREITIPNFRNLPVLLFIDSRDSRLMQLSDVLIGLTLAKECGDITQFRRQMIDSTQCLEACVTTHSVEWNANTA